jgi:microsomal dipeptidase-like Zn-dependent dipeptidase
MKLIFDVIQRASAVIASHSSVQGHENHPGNMSDEMSGRWPKNGGVIQFCLLTITLKILIPLRFASKRKRNQADF